MSAFATALQRRWQDAAAMPAADPHTVTFDAPCPGCGRPTVWASRQGPGSKTTATGPTGPCNHEEGQ